MTLLRKAALGAACLVTLTTSSAGAILGPVATAVRAHNGTVFTAGTSSDGITWDGFCTLAAAAARVGPEPYDFNGYMFGVAVATHPDGPPLDTWLMCEVRVDGVRQEVTNDNPFGPVMVASDTNGTLYVAHDSADVKICAVVSFDRIGARSHTECADVTSTDLPAGTIIDNVNNVLELVDPILCQFLRLLDPVDVPGVLEVTSAGDVFLLNGLLYDCPPYGS